jgi:S1-C subfamily serine protease
MKYVAACFASSVLGGLLVIWLVDPASRQRLSAQDGSPPPAGPRLPQFEEPERPVQRPPLVRPPVDRSPLDSPAARKSGDRQLASLVLNSPGLSPDEAIGVAVYERNNKGVVNITTRSVNTILLLDVSSEGSGSGSVLDYDGHVLTNYHVLEDAQRFAVTLFDGKEYDAKLVGADPNNDIAVIKIDAPRDVLFPIEIADSSDLRVGMRVFAIGNPFGLERTMTTGIISSLNRSLQVRATRSIKSIIQIDAAVNPGNSGGPLINSHGKLIGMNTAIASRNGQSAGVGFAIPSSLIARVVPQLLEHGRVIRPEIGIQMVHVTERGLLIAKLTPEGPAARAGLRGPRVQRKQRGPLSWQTTDFSAADLIVAVDGEPTKNADDFLSMIESKRPRDTVELTIVRESRQFKVPVVLGSGDRL